MLNRTTNNNIQTLQINEVFVFGSNLKGFHYGGAAKIAHEKFGAKMGIGVGITGDTYAIPTMFDNIEPIKRFVFDFINHAWLNSNQTFLVTEIGCGIAGFKPKDIAPLFKDVIHIENIHLPESFWKIILNS